VPASSNLIMRYVVGVDIGGTFTDCVVVDEEGRIAVGKSLSTPDDFAVGAIDAVRDAARNHGLNNEDEFIQSARFFFHACTIGDNTLITRAGAKTALVATKGFADAILMMRGLVTQGLAPTEAAHISALSKPEPLVPRPLVEEVTERVDYKGSILFPLDVNEAEEIVERLMAEHVESVGVCLLWSVANDCHEKALADIFRRKSPRIFLTLSSEVAPFIGEYERTATTVFNAYVGPRISAYLQNLRRVLKEKGLVGEPLIMQAYGGVLGIEATCKNAVGTIESGPASGVVGSQYLGSLIGKKNILATDMGGTTFKVSIIRDGVIEREYKPVILRHSILSSKIWVESIGAGGGSIAWVDPEKGFLKVGPQGAGAKPGPVCYGLGGTEPTVSDADLVLGYLNENYFLGGRMRLDKTSALRAIREKIAQPLGMDEVEAASGIFRIANSHMSDLIRKATVEKGHDPRNFVLFAFGGAGPVHSSRYAAELGIKEVIVPVTASVHGATGLISSDVVYEYGKSDHLLVPADLARLNANFSMLVGKAVGDLQSAGFRDGDIRIIRSLDMRYRYQVHELTVPFPAGMSEITGIDVEEVYGHFDELYEKAYGKGSGYREAGKEILTFRVTAVGVLKKPQIKSEPISKDASRDVALKGKREVYFEERRGFVATDIYDFEKLVPGIEIVGPGVIETPVTTIVLNPGDRAMIDQFRDVMMFLRPKG
jgi:N-methylhydantoinase A